MFAAYFYQGRIFIAKFGDWRWLYEDIPHSAKWLMNDGCGKKLTADEICRQVIQKKSDKITSWHFSSDEVQQVFNSM